jgi:hypothetical protein
MTPSPPPVPLDYARAPKRPPRLRYHFAALGGWASLVCTALFVTDFHQRLEDRLGQTTCIGLSLILALIARRAPVRTARLLAYLNLAVLALLVLLAFGELCTHWARIRDYWRYDLWEYGIYGMT